MWFVRQVRRKNHILEGVVQGSAFQDIYPTLSFHLVPEHLKVEEFIKNYLCPKWSKNGDLIGVLAVSDEMFTNCQLPIPTLDNAFVEDDDFYLMHHCCDPIADTEKLAQLTIVAKIEAKFIKGGHQKYFDENCGSYDCKNPLS